MIRFSEYLGRVRKSTGLSQNSLARSLGVTNTYIHLLEKGKIEAPTEKRCRQLAKVLDVKVEEVLEIARRERLERFAEREGWSPPARTKDEASAGSDLTDRERALIRLLRRLDEPTRKDLEGMVYMLLRHFPEDEVQESLQEFMKRA